MCIRKESALPATGILGMTAFPRLTWLPLAQGEELWQLTAPGWEDMTFEDRSLTSVCVQINMGSQSTGRLWPRLNSSGMKTRIVFKLLPLRDQGNA